MYVFSIMIAKCIDTYNIFMFSLNILYVSTEVCQTTTKKQNIGKKPNQEIKLSLIVIYLFSKSHCAGSRNDMEREKIDDVDLLYAI